MKRQQVNMTEEVVGQQKRSWAEVLSGGNKNLGLSQKAGEGEESKQNLGQKDVHHKTRECEVNLGQSKKVELVDINPVEKEGP
ncbi:hypothetical protein V6N13_060158 [Hibiscus sabdariffa]